MVLKLTLEHTMLLKTYNRIPQRADNYTVFKEQGMKMKFSGSRTHTQENSNKKKLWFRSNSDTVEPTFRMNHTIGPKICDQLHHCELGKTSLVNVIAWTKW
ncbi:unnamed protein product [Camellia sinensis]